MVVSGIAVPDKPAVMEIAVIVVIHLAAVAVVFAVMGTVVERVERVVMVSVVMQEQVLTAAVLDVVLHLKVVAKK